MTPSSDEISYRDAYVRSLEASVLEVVATDGPPLVVLDTTAFYPGGGGRVGLDPGTGVVTAASLLVRTSEVAPEAW